MSERASEDLRKHPRIGPTIIRVQVGMDGEHRQGYLTNLSVGGAFLSMSDPPPTDTIVELTFVLPWGFGECQTRAKTVWNKTSPDRGGVGLSFLDPGEEITAKLSTYLKRFEEMAARIDS